jgi:hypothetical protein
MAETLLWQQDAPAWQMLVGTAEPGSASADALAVLDSSAR